MGRDTEGDTEEMSRVHFEGRLLLLNFRRPKTVAG
jgi:hypothetical protein